MQRVNSLLPLLTLSTLLFACSSVAQIELPPFTSTYSNAGHTHGFYFQTPVPIVIIGLRVPDETNHGTQHVEVFRLTAPPPIYASTGTGGQVFHSINQPSSRIIPCALPFNAGDYVCILGGCGDAMSMRSSYGAGAFVSNVFGQPITLYRFLTQTNIATSGGNMPYSGFTSTSAIGRVEVYVAGHTSSIEYGTGTGASGPAPHLTSTRPVIGQTVTLTLNQQNATNQGGVIALGIGNSTLPFLGGTLLVTPPILASFPLASPLPVGNTPLSFPLPNDPGLTFGPHLNFQGFVLASPALAMSNGIEWKIGY